MISEYLVNIAVAVLREGVTFSEAERMVGVLISRNNKVDNATEVVIEAQRRIRKKYPITGGDLGDHSDS